MAIDTAAKRASATLFSVPAYQVGIFPDGTIGAGDRQAATWMYSGILSGAVAETLLALKSLVLEIASGLGMTLMPNGNTLPISIVTQTPTAAPPGNKGVCFKVSGATLTIYAWDGSVWRAN